MGSSVRPFSPSVDQEGFQEAQPMVNPSGADLDNSNLTKRIEYVDISGTDYPEYIAEAKPGTDEEDESWRVRKLVYTGTNVTSILWADGNAEFDNAADDMANLTYS